ncbi:MAG: SDR family NAD(P)-dependent oxidoreductase [Azospirillaceae bacterium]
MSFRAMRPGDGVAWITGASSGIGAALALELAGRGWTVAASARSVDRLADLARRTTGRDGRIVAMPCDVTQLDEARQTMDRISAELGPVVLAVLNAGTYSADRIGAIDVEAFRKIYDINVMGMTTVLSVLMPRMLADGRGQVVLVGSVSGYGGLPMALAYGSSKAAVINLAESLAVQARPKGVHVQLVSPGFVKTPLTDRNRFRMPFLVPVDKAARIIADGLGRRRFEIAFPWQLALPLKLLRFLPRGLYFRIVGRATGASRR